MRQERFLDAIPSVYYFGRSFSLTFSQFAYCGCGMHRDWEYVVYHVDDNDDEKEWYINSQRMARRTRWLRKT